jgi:hypothetical protein
MKVMEKNLLDFNPQLFAEFKKAFPSPANEKADLVKEQWNILTKTEETSK